MNENITKEYPELARAVTALHENHPGGFIGITEYTSTSRRIVPETSNWIINGHVRYDLVLQRSLEMVERMDPRRIALETAWKLRKHDHAKAMKIAARVGGSYPVAEAAVNEVRMSIERSLAKFEQGEPPDETHYKQLGAGAKRHIETGHLHLSGLQVEKRVVSPGEYKPVNSAPKTLVKQAIQRRLPLGKWRQFRLSPDKFKRVNVAGLVVEGAA